MAITAKIGMCVQYRKSNTQHKAHNSKLVAKIRKKWHCTWNNVCTTSVNSNIWQIAWLSLRLFAAQ